MIWSNFELDVGLAPAINRKTIWLRELRIINWRHFGMGREFLKKLSHPNVQGKAEGKTATSFEKSSANAISSSAHEWCQMDWWLSMMGNFSHTPYQFFAHINFTIFCWANLLISLDFKNLITGLKHLFVSIYQTLGIQNWSCFKLFV